MMDDAMTRRTKKPDYLYHYTTAEGLISIVRNREIWATDIFYLNDQSEFRHGLHLASECSLSKEAKEKHGEEASKAGEGLKTLGPEAIEFNLFVCCFSEEFDALAQWRSYCPRDGYAIGFPFDSLNVSLSNLNVWLRRCVYDEDEQHAMMETLVRGPGRTLNELMTDLINESMRFKRASFHWEKEWRMVHWTSTTCCRDAESTDYRFRPHNGRIIPYAKVRLTDDAMWRKVRVVVGPCPKGEMARSVAAVRRLLGYVGPADKDKVTASILPYSRS